MIQIKKAMKSTNMKVFWGTWQFTGNSSDGSYGRIGNFCIVWKFIGYFDCKLEICNTHDWEYVKRLMPHWGIHIYKMTDTGKTFNLHLVNPPLLGSERGSLAGDQDALTKLEIRRVNEHRIKEKDASNQYRNNLDIRPREGFATRRWVAFLGRWTDIEMHKPRLRLPPTVDSQTQQTKLVVGPSLCKCCCYII